MSVHNHYFHFVYLNKTGRRSPAILKTKQKLFPHFFVFQYLKECVGGDVTSSADITDVIEVSSETYDSFKSLTAQPPMSIVE
ncbi:MAG: hypothetical protein KBC98_01255 [Candidatus Pacebacteria bacterium]|jgi:hypothetical protein|nr:hypothetical protein [Candidatus Paceibacterota bacterium]